MYTKKYQIVDVTSQVEAGFQGEPATDKIDLHKELPGTLINAASSQGTRNETSGEVFQEHLQRLERNTELYGEVNSTWQSQSSSYGTPNSMTVSHSDVISHPVDDMNTTPDSHSSNPRSSHSNFVGYSVDNSLTPQSVSGQSLIADVSTSISRSRTEAAAARLLALRYLPSLTPPSQYMCAMVDEQADIASPLSMNGVPGLQEQQFFDQTVFDDRDGIFVPSSAYQELHSTLRDHLIYTAQSSAPTRQGTPDIHQPDMDYFEKGQSKLISDRAIDRREAYPESVRSPKSLEITPQREYVLWKTWIEEVAPWVS
jgi:hypothetical protein